LREIGLRLAVDDFGTGYSSLAYLQRFPIDILRIDRSFVSDLTDAPDSPMVAAIVQLALTLGLTPLAEGIERLSRWPAWARGPIRSNQIAAWHQAHVRHHHP
jgi:EAL domain-containing protein (putative c-di-GMP-specific phosphodiesterase class I)